MASCGYAALVGGHCGCSAGNPANLQCVTIAHCNKDIQGHLRSFGAGLADSSIKNEAELLLSRAGKKKALCISLYQIGLIISVADLGIGSRGGSRRVRPHPHPYF